MFVPRADNRVRGQRFDPPFATAHRFFAREWLRTVSYLFFVLSLVALFHFSRHVYATAMDVFF